MNKRKLDFSTGDPLMPLTVIARYAFEQSYHDLNVYQMSGQVSSGASLRDLMAGISDYFTARGLHDSKYSCLRVRDMLVTGGGTTEAYELVIRALAADVKCENERRAKFGDNETIKPVIIMPVPTYGLFFEQPKHHGIEIVTIERDMENSGKLDPKALYNRMIELEKEGKRVVAFYDSNPNNPLGTIRGYEETKLLARVIQNQSRRYEKLDSQWSEKIGDERAEPLFDQDDDISSIISRGPNLWRGMASRIKIIDDMIYSGLEYEETEKPVGFAQLDKDKKCSGIYKDTLTLMGPSKAGLVSLRAGLLIANSRYIDQVRKIQQSTSYVAPMTAYHTLHAYFSDKAPFKDWRNHHLQEMNKRNEFAGKFMKAMINGIDDVEVNDTDYQTMINTLADHLEITRSSADERLKSGIKGLNIATNPQSGFFHLLDFSGLKGQLYINYDKNSIFNSPEDIGNLLRETNIQALSSWWLGMGDDNCQVRVTFAKPLAEIVDFTARLQEAVAAMKPVNKQKINNRPPAFR